MHTLMCTQLLATSYLNKHTCMLSLGTSNLNKYFVLQNNWRPQNGFQRFLVRGIDDLRLKFRLRSSQYLVIDVMGIGGKDITFGAWIDADTVSCLIWYILIAVIYISHRRINPRINQRRYCRMSQNNCLRLKQQTWIPICAGWITCIYVCVCACVCVCVCIWIC
jgi:hypothetical protein